MLRLFRRRILALNRIWRRFGTQTLSPTQVCSRMMCEPRCMCATNNPIENDCVTSPVYLDPTVVLFVDPKLAFHLGEHLAELAVRMIARMRRSQKHVGRPALDELFADELEVEGLEYFLEERPVLLVLAEPGSSLLRRFALQFFELLSAFPLLLGRWGLPVVFDELFETHAVDENHSGDVDIFGFHLATGVQAPILITLDISVVIVAGLPTALGGRDRERHDLAGVQHALLILRLARRSPATLSKERG